MCQQLAILKKIHKAKKMNGYAVELAEAQGRDFLQMEKRITNIEKDVSDIKTEQVVQGAKLDLLIKAVQCSQEEASRYRLLVDIWRALFGSTKKTILTFIIFSVIIGIVNIKDAIELIRGVL